MIDLNSSFSFNNSNRQKNEEEEEDAGRPSLGFHLNKNELNTLIANNLKEKKKSFAIVCKTIVSNVVFVMAVILYSSFGAYVFQLLEQHAEMAQCEG